MGCNCSKSSPYGRKPAEKPAPAPSGLSGKTQSFTLNMNNGRTQRMSGSLLEAQAALIRGGGGEIRPS